MGLSWSHVLGDAFSAFNFITMWSQTLAGHVPPKSLHMPNPRELESLHSNSVDSVDPISVVKRATIVGEHWLATSDTKVVTHSFYVTSKQVDHLVATTIEATNQPTKISYFEILSALVWKYIAQIRGDSAPNCVTICTHGTDHRENEFPTNIGLVLSIVEADNVSIGKSDISELAGLIGNKKKVDNHAMEKLVEESEGKEDFIVYGASLTFVDLEEANIYGVKLNGENPIVANCAIHGVGDQGVVLVLPAPEDKEDGNNGRMVTVSLPEEELDQLKEKLGGEWGIASHPNC